MTSKTCDNPTVKLPRELSEQLKIVHNSVSPNGHWPSARNALDALSKSAFDLALSLRRCRTEYEWSQTMSPASLSEADIRHIDGYNVGAREPTGRPVKILFGPVYKPSTATAIGKPPSIFPSIFVHRIPRTDLL